MVGYFKDLTVNLIDDDEGDLKVNLPPPTGDERLCGACFVKDQCALYHQVSSGSAYHVSRSMYQFSSDRPIYRYRRLLL
jgi:hypothetical protein